MLYEVITAQDGSRLPAAGVLFNELFTQQHAEQTHRIAELAALHQPRQSGGILFLYGLFGP